MTSKFIATYFVLIIIKQHLRLTNNYSTVYSITNTTAWHVLKKKKLDKFLSFYKFNIINKKCCNSTYDFCFQGIWGRSEKLIFYILN